MVVLITAGRTMAIITTIIIGRARAGPIVALIAAADPAAVHIAPASAVGAMAAATMPVA